MNGAIVYTGKYGATKQYAVWLAAELNLRLLIAGDGGTEQLGNCDFLILGTPVYAGKLLLRGWLRKNLKILLGKTLFVFVVSGTPPEKKQKLESYVEASVPVEIRNNSQLYFLRGRMITKNISLLDRLMLKVGAMLTKDMEEKKEMKMDFDDVKKENLDELFNSIKKLGILKKQEAPVS